MKIHLSRDLGEKNKNMGEEHQNPNPMYLIPELLEEIFLLLPLKSLLKLKMVSKEWKSILGSRSFTERRLKLKKMKRAILAVGDRTKSRFQGDGEEMEMVYIKCEDAATRPFLACDGLVCIPVPGCVNVLNPSTGEYLSFPSGPDPGPDPYGLSLFTDRWWDPFPGCWTMGFGRDIVSGSYKIVRMFFDPIPSCEILDMSIGEWRTLTPPSYTVDGRRRPTCVNGSIYWLEMHNCFSVLALDLHTEKFRDIPLPKYCSYADQIVNLDNHVAIARRIAGSCFQLEIRILDAKEETWTLIHSIDITHTPPTYLRDAWWIRPVQVSTQGNIFLIDSDKRLFKYYPDTNVLSYLSSNICFVSPFVENLVSLRSSTVLKTSRYQSSFDRKPCSHISKIFRRIIPPVPSILLSASLVSLVMFRYFVNSSRS